MSSKQMCIFWSFSVLANHGLLGLFVLSILRIWPKSHSVMEAEPGNKISIFTGNHGQEFLFFYEVCESTSRIHQNAHSGPEREWISIEQLHRRSKTMRLNRVEEKYSAHSHCCQMEYGIFFSLPSRL